MRRVVEELLFGNALAVPALPGEFLQEFLVAGRADRSSSELDDGGGERFFRQHIEGLQIVGIKQLDASPWSGHARLLDELALRSWLKTSGGKGLHVVVPLAPGEGCDTVKDVSHCVVQQIARVIPPRFVAKSGAAHRVGKILVEEVMRSKPELLVAASTDVTRAMMQATSTIPIVFVASADPVG